ncbi:MAG: STAS domain-containing protein [Actinomycetota bacterium]
MTDERRLKVEITEQKSITTVIFSGKYKPLSIILMREIINALIRNNRLKLIIQFGNLTELDKSAYDYLESVHNEVARLGGSIVLICPSDQPKGICNQLKQKYHFLLFPNFEEARRFFIEREF